MVNHNNKFAIEERRRQVVSLLSQSMTETEIALQLNVDQTTISKDVKALHQMSQTFIADLAKSDLGFFYKQCIEGIEQVNRKAWEIFNDHEGRYPYYRQWRIEHSTHEWAKKTMMAAYESITNDELNYSLKSKLRRSPEQRYQDKKAAWEFHDSDACTNLQCVPNCRYYLEYGRIEDSEIIEDHNKLVEHYRKKNAIIDIELPSEI